ncbi:MAG: hypothetical protein ACREM3_02335 [Candidatus Rokuibacteriota bacterium]
MMDRVIVESLSVLGEFPSTPRGRLQMVVPAELLSFAESTDQEVRSLFINMNFNNTLAGVVFDR